MRKSKLCLIIVLWISISTKAFSAFLLSDGFDFPVGKPDGAGYRVSGYDFLDWIKEFDAYHSGEDWNGVGGGDTDYGDSVYAVSNGIVIASDYYTSFWGNIVLIEHILPNRTVVWSQYAHLKNRVVQEGKVVGKGELIGTIGKGDKKQFPAHLHFEIRKKYRAPDAWVKDWSKAQIKEYYYAPSDYINAHRKIVSSSITIRPYEILPTKEEAPEGWKWERPTEIETEDMLGGIQVLVSWDNAYYQPTGPDKLLANFEAGAAIADSNLDASKAIQALQELSLEEGARIVRTNSIGDESVEVEIRGNRWIMWRRANLIAHVGVEWSDLTSAKTETEMAKWIELIDSKMRTKAVQKSSIFTVVGTVTNTDGTPAATGLEVVVTNETRNLTVTTTVGRQEPSEYGAVFIDMENRTVATEGDILKVTIKDAGKVLANQTYKLTPEDIVKARAIIDVKLRPLQQGPYISSIKPPSGAPGIPVTITGENFDKIVVIQGVYFGGRSATIKEWTNKKIIVKVPYGKGTVEVKVSGPTAHSNSVPFTYNNPFIDQIDPLSGRPDEEVKIIGKDFGYKNGHPTFWVKFGKSLAPTTPWTDTEIVAKAPLDYGLGIKDKMVIIQLIKYAILGWGGIAEEAIKEIIEDTLTNLLAHMVKIPAGEGRIEVGVKVRTPTEKESNAKLFTYNVNEVILSNLLSPGELRIYDSQGRVTGLVNGQVKEEIPYSYCADNTILIVYPDSYSYHYEVIGTDEGAYNLEMTHIKDKKITTFTATDIPTSTKATHQYAVDWDALSKGEKGVILQIDSNGDGKFEQSVKTEAKLQLPEIPKQTALLQNYPNPNPETWIPFQLAESVDVVIFIYDINGRIVRKIEPGKLSAGSYLSEDKAVYWDGHNNVGEKVSSGVYFYHLQAGNYSATKRMLILRCK